MLQVDFAGRVWQCPMCHMRNGLPSQYHGISEQVSMTRDGAYCMLARDWSFIVVGPASMHPASCTLTIACYAVFSFEILCIIFRSLRMSWK